MSEASAPVGRPKAYYLTWSWREYDRALIGRGDLSMWISPDLAWHASEGTGRGGGPPVFSGMRPFRAC